MDHHCPWIGNCVGIHNHNHFVLFLSYLLLGCIYASSMSFLPFLKSTNYFIPWNSPLPRSFLLFSFTLALVISLALTILMSWQFYLLLTGQTSIEYYVNQANKEYARRIGRIYKNSFDFGIKRNFQTFFRVKPGEFWFAWFTPGLESPPKIPQMDLKDFLKKEN